MADDGMLLNFAVAEDLSTNTQKWKGGAWRDRMKAKRGVKTRAQRSDDQDPPNNSNHVRPDNTRRSVGTEQHDFSDYRPAKRQRPNDNPSGSLPGQQSGRNAQSKHAERRQPHESKEVISSLFTYNPTAVTTATQNEEQEPDSVQTKPSNAPLVDGIDTFTSLGLSPTVAAHLLTKMNLKNPTAIQKAAVSQMLKDDSDAFIQSQTGSGKTLAYLLPVVQRIMTMSEQNKNNSEIEDSSLHRDSGLFAIILAPTRELCKQISLVLERLLGCAHYIVAGTVLGGEKKKSEKARLRKGVNILVATPGRLVDHLDNTTALHISSVRWLVLDEGDRLMDEGFEEDITKIVKLLDQKKRKGTRSGLPERRTTVLCSATLKMTVRKLGEISLKEAILIKGDEDETTNESGLNGNDSQQSEFLAPAQLKQSFIVVPAKLRLVTLTALLRRTFARKGSVMKAIVFFSCADSVEFHYRMLSQQLEADQANVEAATGPKSIPPPASGSNSIGQTPSPDQSSQTTSPLLSPSNSAEPVVLYKIHGSLPQPVRTSIIKSFASANTSAPSLLFATDVAARGLDLPNLDLVIEYDPAFSAEDHLHRIGRTARVGRDGRAIIFLLPGKEEGYVEVLHNSYKKTDIGSTTTPSTDQLNGYRGGGGNVTQTNTEEILRRGFSTSVITPTTSSSSQYSADDPSTTTSTSAVPASKQYEVHATNYQLSLERAILDNTGLKDLAKKAFQSHIRAYATHVATERKWFDIKELHLGHLAKSFGLRDPPGRMNVVGQRGGSGKGGDKRRVVNGDGLKRKQGEDGGSGRPRLELEKTKDEDEAARKMRYMVRNKKMMMGGGADEFNIA